MIKENGKTQPFGVRFPKLFLEEMKQLGIETPQKVLNFLIEQYQSRNKAISAPISDKAIVREAAVVDKPALPTADASNEEIQKQIKAIQSEKLPHYILSPIGKKSWEFDQKKRIEALKAQLK